MALIIPPGFAQILIPIRHSGLSRSAAITFGVDSGNWAGDYVDMCNRIGADFNTTWSAQIDSNCSLGPVQAAVGQDAGENLAVNGTFTWSGTAVSDRMPPNVSVLVRKLTSRGGRRGRGRFFVPWALSDATVDEVGRIIGGGFTSLQASATAFLAALNVDPGAVPMVVLHADGNTSPGLPNVVTALQVDSLIGSQRKRLGR